ncbi:FAD/NAD(P)-binding domain-containing protein [Exidia glandulosa HHB12029]|uniref:FAD/NAD(P)-binding domain-containing protein n=1 Tax=Exidia glandulosa HHB12029 TaxID=1314781 RepID=A0A165FYE6_EXIGL|nr:FAD/NAD(P)-binding domain-containing protein [Exidia glandulosa HHB12029]
MDHAHDHPKKYPRIARPVELLRPSYDVVVIGSGYGGGVAASRMARGRQSVCVLERGKERWPGEYPSNLKEAAPQIHVSGALSPNDTGRLRIPVEAGDPTGLYHLFLGEGQNAFVGNGLGGTSLLNANIFLRADPRTLSLKYWPEEIRDDPSKLEKYYERAESMLQPSPYPASFPALKKLDVLQKQAATLGVEDKFYRPPQTTWFHEDGPNSSGVQMKTTTLSGQDSTGVNDGSKITTLVTYLADAWNWGAEIFCECEARYVKKHPTQEGYLVFFAWHGAKRDLFGKENVYEHLMWVHARKMVFLGAGVLGSTEIVLRSKERGLRTSQFVGQDLSGNGDILAFGYNLDDEVNGIGKEHPDPARPIGPTITGVIDLRGEDTAKNPLDGFVIEEGAIASSLAHLFQPMLELSPGRVTRAPLSSIPFRTLRSITSKLFGPYAPGGSVEHTQTYLVMSHDSNQATMTLDPDSDDARIVWQGVGRAEHIAEISETLARLGGTLVQSPFFSLLGQAEITVHAIGGLNLGRATSHLGELLRGDDGAGVHEGLIVTDGAVVPAALGVNPFATITALAERSVEGVAAKLGIDIDYATKNAQLDLFGSPQFPVQPKDDVTEAALIRARKTGQVGIGFTEIMNGFVHVGGEIESFGVAASQARADLQDAQFFLSVNAFDEDALLGRSDHPAMLTGTFSSALPGSPHMVTKGKFGLFTVDERTPDTRNLTYEFDMVGVDGKMLHFSGYKVVNNAAAFSTRDIWEETSTLYVTISDGKLVAGKGTMKIKVSDFVHELATIATTGANVPLRITGFGRFGAFFARQLTRVFFAPFAPLTDKGPATRTLTFAARPVPNEVISVTASDGVVSNMQVWEPTKVIDGKVLNVLFVPGASVDERIFALPTIPLNAIEYFTRAGYRCYAVTTRVGLTPNAKLQGGWSIYDARLDVAAGLKEVVRRAGGEKAYVIAHCAGAVAFASGLLDGTIPARDWIRGITISQVFMHPILGTVNDIKANIPLPSAYTFLARSDWFDCVPQPGLVQHAFDSILKFYPVGGRKEICSSASCHRSELAFGRLWNHANLNAATHDHLDEYLGGVSMKSLRHLTLMGRKRITSRPDGTPLIIAPVKDESALEPEPVNPALENLRGIPILIISGSDNVVFAPEGTDMSYSLLRNTFGAEMYERVVFKGRGHLDSWMSSTCADDGDVYDTVLGHVDAICRHGKLGTGEGGVAAEKREVSCSRPVAIVTPPKRANGTTQ